MSHLDALMTAEAVESGRGQRTSLLCHRRLAREPLVLVLWQLGAEPFSAAAIGWGTSEADFHSAVAGDPRNRTLSFAALLQLAQDFDVWFEAPSSRRETIKRGKRDVEVATTAPQVVVANGATLALLGRLGRRLAYLPTDGDDPADPALVRLGRHLQFLHNHAHVPGQQLVVVMTELMTGNWATGQSNVERQSLNALDAYIDPPEGMRGFDAAVIAEELSVGPLPRGEDDEKLEPLVQKFNDVRGGETSPAIVGPLLGLIAVHYAPLLQRAWQVVWRCFRREAAFEEAPSCERRWFEDCRAYSSHMDWVELTGGRRRTRKTARQAVRFLHDLESAQERLVSEEALDDPLRMIPYLLDGKAIRGTVLHVDRDHMELATKRNVRRPLVAIACDEPCRMPVGKTLYWTGDPSGPEWRIHAVQNASDGSTVTVKLMTSSPHPIPPPGEAASFSILNTKAPYWRLMPQEDPWTHRTEEEQPGSEHLEDRGGGTP